MIYLSIAHVEKSEKADIEVNDRKRILILGGGFAGNEVLRRLESKFENDFTIDIRMVRKDNFFLFTLCYQRWFLAT